MAEGRLDLIMRLFVVGLQTAKLYVTGMEILANKSVCSSGHVAADKLCQWAIAECSVGRQDLRFAQQMAVMADVLDLLNAELTL
ncbi:hypothetical protein NDU88_006854 [Pleurodeles waltl]|uniref:Uncharacterized protein n=1 Tax=Pleurodeles waltl TaxID=8319 RepID=A0AAV7QQ46_PLEWA|nr:hypothetical protein NDU88_006854 [Pleurodeles waltl]